MHWINLPIRHGNHSLDFDTMYELQGSFEEFYQSVPQTPMVMKEYPSFIQHANTSKRGESLIKSFLKKGIFNAIPIGKVGDDFLVKRVLPNGISSFAIVSHDYPTAITISNNVQHLVLSEIIFSDIVSHYFSKSDFESVNRFAIELGENASNLQGFWETFPQNDSFEEGRDARRGALWYTLSQLTGDPLFATLSKCWTTKGEELIDWASGFLHRNKVYPIIERAVMGAAF